MPSTKRPDPNLPALDRFCTYRLHLISKLSDKASAQAYHDELGLTLSEGRCLAAIGQFEPVSVQDLAQRSNLDKANASRAAASLAERKLVTRKAHAQDGRSLVLGLTPSGKALWHQTIDLIARRNHEIFGALSAQESKAMDRALDKILAHLQAGEAR